MGAISLRAWSRPWVDHLEYVLWHALMAGPMAYGRSSLSSAELLALRRRADASGGWVTCDRDGMLWHLPLEVWQDRYSANFEILHMNEPLAPPPWPEGPALA